MLDHIPGAVYKGNHWEHILREGLSQTKNHKECIWKLRQAAWGLEGKHWHTSGHLPQRQGHGRAMVDGKLATPNGSGNKTVYEKVLNKSNEPPLIRKQMVT